MKNRKEEQERVEATHTQSQKLGGDGGGEERSVNGAYRVGTGGIASRTMVNLSLSITRIAHAQAREQGPGCGALIHD